MAFMLPSTVEELNLLQNPTFDFASPLAYSKSSNKGFENIFVGKQYKREYSLPNGVDWNISDFDPYLVDLEDNLKEEGLKAIESLEDRRVPEGDQRLRCESFSSVASSMDEKSVVFQNFGVKTINTVCMDSGSTCISSDHSYVSPSSSFFKGLEAEETYQNLDMFIQEVPEISMNDNMPSPLSSTDSNFELSVLQNFSLHKSGSQDTMDKFSPSKRPAENSSDDDIYGLSVSKKLCDAPVDGVPYTEVRRKNNIASKNCRKTRKEKQKEMETRVTELEKEREGLKVEVQLLEEMIQRHKMQLYAILQKR